MPRNGFINNIKNFLKTNFKFNWLKQFIYVD